MGDGRARIESCGAAVVARAHVLVRHPLGDREPLFARDCPVLRDQTLEVGAGMRTIAGEHVAPVLDPSDEELGTRGRTSDVHEAQPEVPVLEEPQLIVEPSDIAERLGADDHVGAASRDVVSAEKQRGELVGVGKRMQVERALLGVDDDALRVDPGGAGRTSAVELQTQLARRPEVVVVEECEPCASSDVGPDVARPRKPALRLVPDDPHPRIVERPEHGGRLVDGGGVHDDDDLELDVLLGQRARQRVRREERPAVARRDDHADLRLGHRSFPYARQPAAKPPGMPLKMPRRESVHDSRPLSRPDARPRNPQATSRATNRSIRRSPRRRCLA